MHTTEAMTRLLDHQSRILAQVDAMAALLAQPPSYAQAPLARARWTMTRMLREYQLFKHTEIFGPAIVSGDEAKALAGRRMKAACIAAGQQFAAYVAQWSGQDVVARWAPFQAETRATADAVRGHLAREQRQVKELLAGSERTRRLMPG